MNIFQKVTFLLTIIILHDNVEYHLIVLIISVKPIYLIRKALFTRFGEDT